MIHVVVDMNVILDTNAPQGLHKFIDTFQRNARIVFHERTVDLVMDVLHALRVIQQATIKNRSTVVILATQRKGQRDTTAVTPANGRHFASGVTAALQQLYRRIQIRNQLIWLGQGFSNQSHILVGIVTQPAAVEVGSECYVPFSRKRIGSFLDTGDQAIPLMNQYYGGKRPGAFRNREVAHRLWISVEIGDVFTLEGGSPAHDCGRQRPGLGRGPRYSRLQR